MQQKIITLGVRESHSSFHSPDSPTPNHPQNIPTISPKKNKANIPLVLKNEPTNSSSSNNANISNFLSEENLNNIESNSPINCNLSNDLNSNNQYNTGRWTEEEHNKFIEGILEYGNEWKKVQQIIKTRSSTQARSHAQKFFLRVKKIIKINGGSFNINEKDKILENIINSILPNKRGESLNKTQKEKLLSAISSNIKYEGEIKEPSEDDQQLGLDEDNLKYKKDYTETDIIFKSHKNSIESANSYQNNSIFIQRNTSIGQKRKASKIDSKIFSIKKDISHRPSLDIPSLSNGQECNENVPNEINNENELFPNKNSEYNNKIINIGNHNNNEFAENKNIINGYVINNYINVTNNFMNNKYICNYHNNDIINNNLNYNYNFGTDFNYNYNFDKNDSINNDRNYSYGFLQCPEKNIFNTFDKPFLNGQFNKTAYNNLNYCNRINNENDNNVNSSNPFELNFMNFSNDNYNNNENEQQISIPDEEFFKVNNTEENID